MSSPLPPEAEACPPAVYQVRLKGHLGKQWQDWFGGLKITQTEAGETLITGRLEDQAALHGLLRRVRDLGLALISVVPLTSDQTTAGEQPA